MTTPSITTSLPDPRVIGRAVRLALVAVALAVVLAGGFLAGRATGGTTGTSGVSHPVTSPAGGSDLQWCRVTHFISEC